jgi:hypothetical protein
MSAKDEIRRNTEEVQGPARHSASRPDLAGCLNNSTRRIPTDTLDVDPVNDPPSRAEK